MLEAGGNECFPLTFKADYEGSNYLIVEIHYTSPFFAEKLQKYIGSQEEIDFNKKKDTKDYTIDYGKRLVTRKHAKKFKFLTLSPFKI